METAINHIKHYITKQVNIAPLAVFRMAFGFLMLGSVLRFIAKGWVYSMYIKPKVFFPFYGFEWVKPIDAEAMYAIFIALAIVSLCIALGFFYRLATIIFFVLFTYVELIDKTNYLNHYYFISIMSFIMMFLPANKAFALDTYFKKNIAVTHIPNYFVLLVKAQVFVVYFFAGVAKLNYDWLFEAQPLKIWLPANSEMPIIGDLLTQEWVAYFFSWFGCIYDLAIPFFLFIPRFVRPAYFFVIVFHLATSMLFNIGMFPYIMIALTTIFFREQFHIKIIDTLKAVFKVKNNSEILLEYKPSITYKKAITYVFVLHFAIQLVLPFRYLLYPGELFWTEQGFRFSWRVMLIEKAGTAFFYIKDKTTGKEIEVNNREYLTQMQEKMMATQPDMLINYAHFLKHEFELKGMKDVDVVAESYVTLNGSPSQLMVDKTTVLSSLENNYSNKSWILPFKQNH